MAVKIRMKRIGAKKRPFYRIVVADSRRAVKGKFIEEIGFYNPISDPRMFRINADKVKEWMSNGAKPSDTVNRLFKEYGVYEGKGIIEQGCSNEAKPKKHYDAEPLPPKEEAVEAPEEDDQEEAEAPEEAEAETQEAEAGEEATEEAE